MKYIISVLLMLGLFVACGDDEGANQAGTPYDNCILNGGIGCNQYLSGTNQQFWPNQYQYPYGNNGYYYGYNNGHFHNGLNGCGQNFYPAVSYNYNYGLGCIPNNIYNQYQHQMIHRNINFGQQNYQIPATCGYGAVSCGGFGRCVPTTQQTNIYVQGNFNNFGICVYY